jgi:hypothetical protein
MVTIEESRRFTTNYFRLVSDSQVVGKNVKKTISDRDSEYKLDDVEYVNINPVEGSEFLLEFHQKSSMLEQYVFELKNGFNLTFYGFGRKFQVVKMIEERLGAGCSVFINGYDPLLTLNGVYSVLSKNGVDLRNPCSTSLNQQPVFVVIYGFDSFRLRNENFYRLLADATSTGFVRLLATVEDPNYTLLLSPKVVSKLT